MNRKEVPNGILINEVDELLNEGHEVIIRTKGSSMLPFIRGEKDSVKLVRTDKLEPMDIVLARISKDRFVLHRIIGIDGDELSLMGDGNLKGTEHCLRQDVLGKVTEIIRPDGTVSIPKKGSVWLKLLPFRRIILGIYRRMI